MADHAIRLILCDDQAIVTEGLQVILGTVAGFEIIGVGDLIWDVSLGIL